MRSKNKANECVDVKPKSAMLHVYSSVNFVLTSNGLPILFPRTYLTHFSPFQKSDPLPYADDNPLFTLRGSGNSCTSSHVFLSISKFLCIFMPQEGFSLTFSRSVHFISSGFISNFLFILHIFLFIH